MVSHHSSQIVVQIPPSVVVIVVDEPLLFQPLTHSFVLTEEDRAIHYLFLNQEQGNQKGLDWLFAMAWNYDRTLESRRMCRGSLTMDGKILGFVRTEVDL